jgi:acylphosphatase
MQGDTARRRLIIHGHVQGVFFRDSLRDCAESHGVAGWTSNREDGTVEAVLEGPRQAVEEVLRFASSGPSRARVERVEGSDEEPEGLSGFEVR